MSSLDIIIVNYNSGDGLKRCLESIKRADKKHFELGKVIVVDNASSDRSADFSIQMDELEIIRNEKNIGFAAACNMGASAGDSELVLFLNPDVELFADSLDVPVNFLLHEAPDEVGIVGIQLVDLDGRVTRTSGRIPHPANLLNRILLLDRISPRIFKGYLMNDWDHGNSAYVGQVTGAFFLIARDLFERLGGFDERFFIYFEELDLSLRAARAGYKSYYLAGVKAMHEGGVSSRSDVSARNYYLSRSRILFAFKHFNSFEAWVVTAAVLTIEPIVRFVGSLVRFSPAAAASTISTCRRVWRDLGEILSERSRNG